MMNAATIGDIYRIVESEGYLFDIRSGGAVVDHDQALVEIRRYAALGCVSLSPGAEVRAARLLVGLLVAAVGQGYTRGDFALATTLPVVCIRAELARQARRIGAGR